MSRSKKKKVSWSAIGLGGLLAVLLVAAIFGDAEKTIGSFTIQEIGIALTGIFGSIAAILWLMSKKQKKPVLHESETEFLTSIGVFATLSSHIGIPVLQAFALI